MPVRGQLVERFDRTFAILTQLREDAMTYHPRPPNRRHYRRRRARRLSCLPRTARAQGARELVIVSFAGSLQEPHQWLARRMEASIPA